MTVYGGPRPTPPAPKPDPILLGAFGFLVLAVIVGVILGARAFMSDPGGTAAPQQERTVDAGASPAPAAPSSAPTSSPSAPAQSASSTPAKNGFLAAKATLLVAGHTGMCLLSNPGDGGNASQQPCDGNNPAMVWVPQLVQGSQNTFRFVNAGTEKCLDVNGASRDNGANVLAWDCHGGPNQQWRLDRDGDGYRVVSINSGKCMGIDNNKTNPGALARQWDCDASANQRWKFQQ
jgi:hypothetical protein